MRTSYSSVLWNIVMFLFSVVYSQDETTHETCTLPSGLQGYCIPIRSCTFHANLFKPAPKPLSASNIDSLHSYHCGFQGTSPTPKVCCPHPPGAEPETTVSGIDQEVVQTDSRFEEVLKDRFGSINQDSCGGKVQSLAKYPWMALLAYNTSSGTIFKCGGTLINENYVLTAAQCIVPSLIAVRLGEYDTSTEIDCFARRGCAPPVQDVTIAKTLRHSRFNGSTMENDIGLIRLSRPANIRSESIKPVCLPIRDETDSLLGKYADVTGWGVTETGFASNKLLKVSLPIIPSSSCQQSYRDKGIEVTISGGHLCAGGLRGKDACSGDGGGPLGIVNPEGVFVQHGIVSFGSRFCGNHGLNLPGVYTNVAKYINWILINTKE